MSRIPPTEISSEANNLMVLIGCFFLILWIVHLLVAWYKISEFWKAHRRRLVVRMDGISREIASVGNIQPHHFRELMRSRHKSPEGIQVLKYVVPFSLHRNSLTSTWLDTNSRNDNTLGITFKFDCTMPGLIQAYWGVTIDSSAPGPEPWTMRAIRFENEIAFEQNPQNSMVSYLSVFGNQTCSSTMTPVTSLLRTSSYIKASSPFSFTAGKDITFALTDGLDALDPRLSLNYSRMPSPTSIPLVIAVSFLPPTDSGREHVCSQLLCLEFEIADGLDLTPSSNSTVTRNPPPRANLLKLITVTPNNVYDVQEVFGHGEEEDDCVVCLTDPKSTILMPCRHFCICDGCLEKLDKCPICRADFKGFLKCRPASKA